MLDDPDAQIAPEFARWALRSVLTAARQKAGLSASEVTTQLHWGSERKIKRIEDGDVAVRPLDLRVLLKIYGISDPPEIQQLVDFAVASKQKSIWWRYSDLYSPDARTMFAVESAATTIRQHVPNVVPSLFQAEEYCRALLAGSGLPADEIDRRVEVTLARQDLSYRRSPHFEVILAEAVVARPIGGPTVMRKQIEYLKDLADQDNIELQILPMSVGAYPHLGVLFTMMEFDEDVDDLLFLEDAEGRTFSISDPNRTPHYRRDFDLLRDLSAPASEFAETVDRVVSQRRY